jgi:transposase-like protein
MDDQAQVVEVQRRRSRAEAEQVAGEYEGSGLSRVEFCRQHGLSLATLARYRKRQAQAQGKAALGNRWVTVEVSGASSTLESRGSSGLAVALPGGRRIDVGRGFDSRTLVQLLVVLER